jgi:hypothetical protein
MVLIYLEAAGVNAWPSGAPHLQTTACTWFTHDDERCGAPTTGRLADLAVLTRDIRG